MTKSDLMKLPMGAIKDLGEWIKLEAPYSDMIQVFKSDGWIGLKALGTGNGFWFYTKEGSNDKR